MNDPHHRIARLMLCALLATGASAAFAQDGDGATATPSPTQGQGQPGGGMLGQPGNARRGPVTNLPLPRYVSLKGSEGNARRGPSLSHRVDWVFRHAGMPLRVTAEYGQWRRVEDRDGAGGWVHYSLLSGVRTAVVEDEMAELRTRPNAEAPVSARAEAGAVVKLDRCTADWCEVTGGGAKGWLPKTALWGVDPEELRD